MTRELFTLQVAEGIAQVAPAAWDALVSPDDPFTTHAFLQCLEQSGSACMDSGWQPLHLLLYADERLVGAAPVYLKTHSYGEYIFDWGWAEASHRAGIPYYPKLVCAVPFTPATGRRLLTHPDADTERVQHALLDGLGALAKATEAHSTHVLFLTEDEYTRASAREEYIGRVTSQFHWTNPGVSDFEGWLGTFRSKLRKETRRERSWPAKLGATIQVVPGDALTDAHWTALEGFYRSTVRRKHAEAYLTPGFFQQARRQLAATAVGILAEKDGQFVAGALAFQRGEHLYGRYWGCLDGFEKLHFEICYHRPIELCLERGWTRFEAGAQGAHKLRRGLMPAETWSAHWLSHPGLARAVDDACDREGDATRRHIGAIATHGPQRRGPRES